MLADTAHPEIARQFLTACCEDGYPSAIHDSRRGRLKTPERLPRHTNDSGTCTPKRGIDEYRRPRCS